MSSHIGWMYAVWLLLDLDICKSIDLYTASLKLLKVLCVRKLPSTLHSLTWQPSRLRLLSRWIPFWDPPWDQWVSGRRWRRFCWTVVWHTPCRPPQTCSWCTPWTGEGQASTPTRCIKRGPQSLQQVLICPSWGGAWPLSCLLMRFQGTNRSCSMRAWPVRPATCFPSPLERKDI